MRQKAKTPPERYLKWMEENLKYNPWSGVLWNKCRSQPSKPPGHKKLYVKVRCKDKLFSAHRVIWFLQTGLWPDDNLVIDHINGARNDNRWMNLRQVTTAENNANRHEDPGIFILVSALSNNGIYFDHNVHDKYSEIIIENKLSLLFTEHGEYMTTRENKT